MEQSKIDRINELAVNKARNSDFRFIKDEEIDELRSNAEFFGQQAQEEYQVFESCSTVLASLKEKQERLENQRRGMAPLLALAMSRMEKIDQEQDAIISARTQMENAAAQGGKEVNQALAEAGSGLEKALEANRRQAQAFQAELEELQQRTAQIDEELSQTRQEYDEAAGVIENVTAKWLYKESSAASARADLAEIERTAEEREEFRRQREAAAAVRASSHPAGNNQRTPIWRKRKRG